MPLTNGTADPQTAIMVQFLAGLRHLLAGFHIIMEPRIRLYMLIPLAVNTLLFAGAFAYGASLLRDLIHWLSAQWGWLEWLAWLLWPLFVVIALTVMFVCFSTVANLIASPFNGFLAAAVEEALAGTSPRAAGASGRTLALEIRDALFAEGRKFLYFGVRALPLLLLFFIPLVQLAAPFVWILFGAWMLALEYLDYPLGNRGMLFPEVRKIIAARKSLTLGFGLGVLVLTLIPVLNFVAMPVAVAGATRLVVKELIPAAAPG